MDDLRELKVPRKFGRGRDKAQGVKGFLADESGAIALIMTLLLVVVLGMSALVIDYGYMSVVQNQLKKAADAGALAGANALANNADWNTAATLIVQKNQAAGELLTDCQVQSGYWSLVQHKFLGTAPQETPAPLQAIQVVVAKNASNNGGPLQLSFAPVLGVSSVNLSGTSVAVVKPSEGMWSILETGNGTLSISNNANVSGDVGVNGDGPFSMGNNATVQGKAYLNTACSKSVGNNATIEDGIQQDNDANVVLQQASQAVTTAYNNFTSLSSTMAAITTVNSTRTITGTGGVNVLHVTNFIPSNNAIITLSAPAGASFVIQVATAFSLNNNAQVVLSGGITSDGVTFVFTQNNGTATLNNNSILNGSILSPNSNITLSNNASIDGGVLVSGKNISLNNNSVTTDKIPSGWGSFYSGSGGGGGAALVQ